jgi:hypothetical protein
VEEVLKGKGKGFKKRRKGKGKDGKPTTKPKGENGNQFLEIFLKISYWLTPCFSGPLLSRLCL